MTSIDFEGENIISILNRKVTSMNILDAHKIIYDYIDTVSNKKGKFFRLYSLKNSVVEIEAAWKLYFAHIIIFKNWESPEWLDTFETLISMLPYFYSDIGIEDYYAYEKKINNYQKSFFRFFYKKEISELQQEQKHILELFFEDTQDFMARYGENGIYTGLKDSYRQAVLDIADKYDASQFDLKTYSGIYQYFDHVADICTRVYKAAEIPLNSKDVKTFLPFPLLPIVLQNFNHDKDGNEIITGHYKDYILSNLQRRKRNDIN